MTAFSFYKDVTLLDSQKHRKLRFKPFDDIRFAGGAQSALLSASEIPDCAVEYPVIFAPTRDGPVAIALFGLRPNENLFVTPDGKWDGRYIPAFLRRYPFLPATSPSGEIMIAIDETCANLGVDEGELLIDGDGKATPYLGDLMKFIERVHADYARSAAFAKSLADRGLLRDMNAEIKLDSGEKLAVTGFQIADESKLAELPDAELAALSRNGQMALIHAHLLSLRNLPKLMARLNRTVAAEPAATQH
jgi:hypothetical protein